MKLNIKNETGRLKSVVLVQPNSNGPVPPLRKVSRLCANIHIKFSLNPAYRQQNIFSPSPQISPGKTFRIAVKVSRKPQDTNNQNPVVRLCIFDIPYLGRSMITVLKIHR